MKKLLLFLIAICFILKLSAQNQPQVYDSTLAKSLGADDYGMKSYVFVILKTGSNKLEQGAERDSLFKGHMSNINKLAEEGKLVVAGPFGANDKSYRGLFILNVRTIAEARKLLDTDPTVLAKIFDVEMYEWYGSAALGEYLKIHKKIEKSSF